MNINRGVSTQECNMNVIIPNAENRYSKQSRFEVWRRSLEKLCVRKSSNGSKSTKNRPTGTGGLLYVQLDIISILTARLGGPKRGYGDRRGQVLCLVRDDIDLFNLAHKSLICYVNVTGSNFRQSKLLIHFQNNRCPNLIPWWIHRHEGKRGCSVDISVPLEWLALTSSQSIGSHIHCTPMVWQTMFKVTPDIRQHLTECMQCHTSSNVTS